MAGIRGPGLTEGMRERTDAEKRHDQLTSAPNSTEADAAPRIDVSTTAEGRTRIDIRDDAEFRPGADPDNL